MPVSCLSLSLCDSLGPGCDSLAKIAASSPGQVRFRDVLPVDATADEETVNVGPKLVNKCERNEVVLPLATLTLVV